MLAVSNKLISLFCLWHNSSVLFVAESDVLLSLNLFPVFGLQSVCESPVVRQDPGRAFRRYYSLNMSYSPAGFAWFRASRCRTKHLRFSFFPRLPSQQRHCIVGYSYFIFIYLLRQPLTFFVFPVMARLKPWPSALLCHFSFYNNCFF